MNTDFAHESIATIEEAVELGLLPLADAVEIATSRSHRKTSTGRRAKAFLARHAQVEAGVAAAEKVEKVKATGPLSRGGDPINYAATLYASEQAERGSTEWWAAYRQAKAIFTAAAELANVTVSPK